MAIRSREGRNETELVARFVLRKGTNGDFYFNLKASNGSTILTSERYRTRESAELGIDSVKTNAVNGARYDRKSATNEKCYFLLKAPNHDVIGTSDLYASAMLRESAIEELMRTAPVAPTEDLT